MKRDLGEEISLFWQLTGQKTNGESDKCLALAVTSDGNINQLGDGDDGDLGVQDDAKIMN